MAGTIKSLILSNGEYKKYNAEVIEHLSQIPKDMTSNKQNGIVISTNSTNVYGWANGYQAFDGSKINSSKTGWANGPNQLPIWLQIDYGIQREIVHYKIHYNYGSSNYPSAWKMQGSNNGSTWIDLDSRTVSSWAVNEEKSFNIVSPGQYRYYRLYVTKAGNSHAVITELEMYEKIKSSPGYYSIVSNALPTPEEFNSQGMDDLSVVKRKITKTTPVKMDALTDSGDLGKMFQKTIDMKRHPIMKNIEVDTV